MKPQKDGKIIGIGVVAGFIASLCCLGPILLILFGLSGVSFALSIGKYTWFFASLATIFLITAIIFYLRKKNCCNINGIKNNWFWIFTTFIIMIVILVVIKFWLATYLAEIVYKWR